MPILFFTVEYYFSSCDFIELINGMQYRMSAVKYDLLLRCPLWGSYMMGGNLCKLSVRLWHRLKPHCCCYLFGCLGTAVSVNDIGNIGYWTGVRTLERGKERAPDLCAAIICFSSRDCLCQASAVCCKTYWIITGTGTSSPLFAQS